jgi:hypothetical protein
MGQSSRSGRGLGFDRMSIISFFSIPHPLGLTATLQIRDQGLKWAIFLLGETLDELVSCNHSSTSVPIRALLTGVMEERSTCLARYLLQAPISCQLGQSWFCAASIGSCAFTVRCLFPICVFVI